jgi:hypothetical protein
MPLFFNSGHIRRGLRDHYDRYFSHLELESLPTAGWGYDHFPLSARYVDPLGIPFVGMTGKFHTRWGEVGGYKKAGALIYECGAMLAHGARCSIGDHLHPTGAIDGSTMRLIAPAYAWVKEREAWYEGTVGVAEVALLSAESLLTLAAGDNALNQAQLADEGASRVLLEAGYLFDVVDRTAEFERYRLLILPDVVFVDDELRDRIDNYAANGGRVLLTGSSGLSDAGFAFHVGATSQGTSSNNGGEYFLPRSDLRAPDIDDPVFMYRWAHRIEITDGQSVVDVVEPYFDRDPHHFSGHIHAPYDPERPRRAAGSTAGAFTYLAFPIFSAYREVGAVVMLEMAERLILASAGMAEKLVSTSLPRAGRVTVRRDMSANRDVLTLLHATPALRGTTKGSSPVQPIQDLVELRDVRVSIRRWRNVSSVRVIPENTPLAFDLVSDRIEFKVPRLVGHAMIEIAYASSD